MTLLTPQAPAPGPAFRRRIILVLHRDGASTRVRAALEDDFHHFRVELECESGHVKRLAGDAPRHPYTLCKFATSELTHLVGMPLGSTPQAATRFTSSSEQCTHLFDLAGLAIAAAARGTPRRQYDIVVPQREEQGRTQPVLWCDGVERLTWEVNGDLIEGPPPYTSIPLRAGLARWALTTLPEEEAEFALVLRRCTAIAVGRIRDLDAQVHARASGSCYAQQPQRAQQALRVRRSTLDFSASADPLCQADLAWLALQA